jgi:hypothetical protein
MRAARTRTGAGPRQAPIGNRQSAIGNISYGVAELERRESLKLVYVGSSPTSVASVEMSDMLQLVVVEITYAQA